MSSKYSYSTSQSDKPIPLFPHKRKHKHRRDRDRDRDRDESDSEPQPSSFAQTLSSFISPRVNALNSIPPPLVISQPAPPPAPTPPTSSNASMIFSPTGTAPSSTSLVTTTSTTSTSNGSAPPSRVVSTSSRRAITAGPASEKVATRTTATTRVPLMFRLKSRLRSLTQRPIPWQVHLLLPVTCFLSVFLAITASTFVQPYIPAARSHFESFVTTIHHNLPTINIPLPGPLINLPLLQTSSSHESPGTVITEYLPNEHLTCTIDTTRHATAVQLKLVKGCLSSHSKSPYEVVDGYTCPKEVGYGGGWFAGSEGREECWRKCKDVCLSKGVKVRASRAECTVNGGGLGGGCWARYKY